MGVVIRMWVWLECVGVVSGCCCKDRNIYTYRFPHTIPTPLVLALFLQRIPLLCSLKKFFAALVNKVCLMFGYYPLFRNFCEHLSFVAHEAIKFGAFQWLQWFL